MAADDRGDDIDFLTDDDEEETQEALGGGDDPGSLRGSLGGGGGVVGGVGAASTWQEVDRAALAASALALVSSVAQTAPADDRARDAVWHPTSGAAVVAIAQHDGGGLADPLGFGRIDVANRRLVAVRS